jgi:hypothetical protein
MTFVTYHYGASTALNMLDELTRFIYHVNEKTGSSLSTQIFETIPKEVFEITQQRLDRTNKIISDYLGGADGKKENHLTEEQL